MNLRQIYRTLNIRYVRQLCSTLNTINLWQLCSILNTVNLRQLYRTLNIRYLRQLSLEPFFLVKVILLNIKTILGKFPWKTLHGSTELKIYKKNVYFFPATLPYLTIHKPSLGSFELTQNIWATNWQTCKYKNTRLLRRFAPISFLNF